MSNPTARPSRYVATLVAACLAVMVAQVAYSLPGALNGTFQQDFNISGAELTWISAAFATTMVVFELTFGVLGDMFGRKRLLLGGALLIVVGAALCASAQEVHLMWIGQAIAGIGAGALYPISLAMIAAAAPDAQARARAIALWAGFLSLGAALSPDDGRRTHRIRQLALGFRCSDRRRTDLVCRFTGRAGLVVAGRPQARPPRSGNVGGRPDRPALGADAGIRDRLGQHHDRRRLCHRRRIPGPRLSSSNCAPKCHCCT